MNRLRTYDKFTSEDIAMLTREQIARDARPKTWGDDEGWGEWTNASEWCVTDHDVQMECVDGIHRVRTRPRTHPAEPKRKTVMLRGGEECGWGFYQNGEAISETHLITFDLIDGKPDVDSIKMEEL